MLFVPCKPVDDCPWIHSASYWLKRPLTSQWPLYFWNASRVKIIKYSCFISDTHLIIRQYRLLHRFYTKVYLYIYILNSSLTHYIHVSKLFFSHASYIFKHIKNRQPFNLVLTSLRRENDDCRPFFDSVRKWPRDIF